MIPLNNPKIPIKSKIPIEAKIPTKTIKLDVLDTSTNKYVGKYYLLSESLIDDKLLLTDGKYSSKSFNYVWQSDKAYCQGLISRNNIKNPQLILFKKYCQQEARKETSNIKFLRVMVSEISSLAGHHKYCSPDEAVTKHLIFFEKTFKRYVKYAALEDDKIHKHNYEVFIKIFQSEYVDEEIPQRSQLTYELELRKLRYRYPQIYNLLSELPTKSIEITSENIISNSELINNLTHDVAELLEDNIDNFEEVVNEITTNNHYSDEIKIGVINNLPKVSGLVFEDSIYQKLLSRGYDVRDSQKSFNDKVTIKDITVIIIGKVDGILYENGIPTGIVEIKNRQNNFFIPEYDIDQIATYVMLSKLSKGILVQSLNGELEITVFTRDELRPYWNRLLGSKILYTSLQTILRLKSNCHSAESIIFAKEHLLC